MPKPLHIGLIGSKFMGRTHSNAYLNVAKFFDLPRDPVMHTLAARNLEETQAFADRWGWTHATDNWKAMVQDPEIGLVDVGTPNHVHRDQAIAALEAGKHVACEKPLANTLDAAREMVAAAKKAAKNKQKTFVWYNYRRCPALAFAHQLVKEGRLGRIYHVRGFYLQDWAGPDTPMLWRFQGAKAGSGSLGDLCAHSIDAARFVTGDEFSVIHGGVLKTFIKERTVLEGGAGGEISGRGASTKKSKKAKSTVDDAVVFTAEMKGGAVATFEATRLSTGDKNGNKLESSSTSNAWPSCSGTTTPFPRSCRAGAPSTSATAEPATLTPRTGGPPLTPSATSTASSIRPPTWSARSPTRSRWCRSPILPTPTPPSACWRP